MATKQDVIINVIADTKKAVMGMAKFAVGIGAAVMVAKKLVKVGADMVNAFGEQEKAETKLAAAIRATGRENEMSTERLGELASSLQKVTTFGDEATLSAMAMTQQLGNLSQEGLEKVTPGILDFAAAMDVDLNTAASLIGKTLGSSTNALTRYGVEIDMTGTETEKLASLTQALNDKFGGTAEALASTTAGGMVQFQNAVGDLKEAGGEMIANFLAPTISKLTDLITKANEAREATKEFRDLVKTGADEEALLKLDEKRFEQLKKNIAGGLLLDEFMATNDDIIKQIIKIAEYQGASLGVVADTAIEMGLITQEALNQDEAYKRFIGSQARAAAWASTIARDTKDAADEAKRKADIDALNVTNSKLIAEYSADFFPQEPLTRIEETAEALATIQESINAMALLGGDLTDLGALRDALKALLGELKLADEMGDPADLVFAPLIGLGPPGQIDRMNGVTMAMKLQGEVLAGVAAVLKDPSLLDLPRILQGKGPVDFDYYASILKGDNLATGKKAVEELAFAWEGMGTAVLDAGVIDLIETLPVLTEEEQKLKDVTDKLGDSLKEVFGRETLEMLEGFGAAMVSGSSGAEMAAQSVEDFAKAILDNLPTLLFQAGLAAMSGGLLELGAGLIVASGIAAVVKGAVNASEPTGVSGGGSSATVNNYNTYAPSIAGSMIVERDVTSKLLTSSAGTNRGY